MEENKSLVEPRNRDARRDGIVLNLRTMLSLTVLVLVLIASGLGVHFYLAYANQWVRTDNAFVYGQIFTVSAAVPGAVHEVLVTNGVRVTKGTPLLTLDSTQMGIAVRKAEAAMHRNRIGIENLGALPQSSKELEIAKAIHEELSLALEEARLLYNATTSYAPVGGYVANVQVVSGERVLPGQPLMAIVRLDNVWIRANFSEEQIRHVRVGQEVDIYIDAYPTEAFRGRIRSVLPTGGSAFALFPPDATAGNWVRTTQRVPVEIEFAPDELERRNISLKIGMLARVRVER